MTDIRMNEDAYLEQLTSLVPEGDIWPRNPGSTLSKYLTPAAGEFAKVDGRAADLIEEADPRTTSEMLTDWERVLGLPDPCTGQLPTIAQRRQRIVQKLTLIGGQSRAYFISVAEQIGYAPPTIDEFLPFTVNSTVDDFLYTDPWRYVWRMNMQEETLVTYFTCNSGCDEFLSNWGDDLIECVINQLKPAHTHVLFSYGNEA